MQEHKRCWRAAEDDLQGCKKELPLRLPRQRGGVARVPQQEDRGVLQSGNLLIGTEDLGIARHDRAVRASGSEYRAAPW